MPIFSPATPGRIRRGDRQVYAGHKNEVGYLASNWQGVFGVKDFPDFSEPIFEKRLKEFPVKYKQFMQEDFEQALRKYRLDYIVIKGEPSADTEELLQSRTVLYTDGDVKVYQF